jgi:hypothetical protein
MMGFICDRRVARRGYRYKGRKRSARSGFDLADCRKRRRRFDSVMPAKAGIQQGVELSSLDPGFRRGDE